MEFKTNEIKTKITSNGEKIIAFRVSDEDFAKFTENIKSNKEYKVVFERLFGEKTYNQRAYLNALIRKLSEKMRTSFDEMYYYIMTEDGIEETETVDGIEVQKVIYIANTSSEEAIKKAFKNEHFYLKSCQNGDGFYAYRIFKGVKLMNSREIAIVIDRLINRCNDAGIPIISPRDYKKKVQKNA